MTVLERQLWAYSTNGQAVTSNNAYMPDNAPASSNTATIANGRLFDTSAWETWTLMGFATVIPTTLFLWLLWFDDANIGRLQGTLQEIRLPQSPVGSSVPFLITGKVLGRRMTAQLTASATFVGALDFFVSHRPRLYDAPHMPGLFGTTLAGIAQTSKAATTRLSVDLPYYLGPAVITVNAAGDTAATELGVFADLIDDGAPLQSIGYVNSNAGTQRLWVPNLRPTATKWTLEAVNNSAATQTIGAALVAG